MTLYYSFYVKKRLPGKNHWRSKCVYPCQEERLPEWGKKKKSRDTEGKKKNFAQHRSVLCWTKRGKKKKTGKNPVTPGSVPKAQKGVATPPLLALHS